MNGHSGYLRNMGIPFVKKMVTSIASGSQKGSGKLNKVPGENNSNQA